MNNHFSETKYCCCSSKGQNVAKEKKILKSRKTLKAIPSILLSFLIAFFPKCPICWGVYMSMFGSIGLARLPFMEWLLPVLMVFLVIHLYVIYKKATSSNYLPFFLSLAGSVIILFGRFSFENVKWILMLGMIFILAGSLLVQFPNIRTHLFAPKHNTI